MSVSFAIPNAPPIPVQSTPYEQTFRESELEAVTTVPLGIIGQTLGWVRCMARGWGKAVAVDAGLDFPVDVGVGSGVEAKAGCG